MKLAKHGVGCRILCDVVCEVWCISHFLEQSPSKSASLVNAYTCIRFISISLQSSWKLKSDQNCKPRSRKLKQHSGEMQLNRTKNDFTESQWRNTYRENRINNSTLFWVSWKAFEMSKNLAKSTWHRNKSTNFLSNNTEQIINNGNACSLAMARERFSTRLCYGGHIEFCGGLWHVHVYERNMREFSVWLAL